MSKTSSFTLKTAIPKKLLLRLTLATVSISVVLGVIVNYTNRNDVGEAILERLMQATRRFNTQASAQLNA